MDIVVELVGGPFCGEKVKFESEAQALMMRELTEKVEVLHWYFPSGFMKLSYGGIRTKDGYPVL